MRYSFIIVIVLYIIAPTFTSGQNLIGDEKEIEKILFNIKTFSEHIMASDYDAIAAAYTEDGKIFPSGRDIIEGREDIRKYWVLPEGRSTKYHKVKPEEIKIIGDEAYDYGYYEGVSLNAQGQESSWKGKYVIVWKKVEGEWKIYLDIWNRI